MAQLKAGSTVGGVTILTTAYTPPTASEVAVGAAELATHAETDAGTDDTRTVTPHKLISTPMLYRRNAIINGDMRVAQRGVGWTGVTAAAYTLDRWVVWNATDGALNVSQGAGPTPEFQSSLVIGSTSLDASIAAGQSAGFQQVIEGYNVPPMIGKTIALSFWVKSSKTGIYCVSLQNTGADRSYLAEYTISQANTWEQKVITIVMDYSGGTWNYTNAKGLTLSFMLACGSTYHGAAGSWLSAQKFATANQVNWMDSASATFYITGIQLEVGSAATPFEHRPMAYELSLCQRYFQKSYLMSIVPGTGSGDGVVTLNPSASRAGEWATSPLLQRMRAAATVTVYSYATGTANRIRNISGGVDITPAQVIGCEANFFVDYTSTDGNLYAYHWAAVAEL